MKITFDSPDEREILTRLANTILRSSLDASKPARESEETYRMRKALSEIANSGLGEISPELREVARVALSASKQAKPDVLLETCREIISTHKDWEAGMAGQDFNDPLSSCIDRLEFLLSGQITENPNANVKQAYPGGRYAIKEMGGV